MEPNYHKDKLREIIHSMRYIHNTANTTYSSRQLYKQALSMPDTPPERLDSSAINTALSQLPGWQRIDDSIEKSLTFKDFSSAFGFMTRVAMLCETQNHHPSWSNTWNQVSIRLSTHECGGLSYRDIELAASIEQLLQSSN